VSAVRILFAAVDAHGHVYPLLPLADAALKAGHEVLFGTGEAMFPTLRRAGLEPVKVGMPAVEAFDRVLARLGPDEDRAEKMTDVGATVFGSLIPRTMFATVKPVIERFGADLVISEISSPGAAFAAEYLGVPAAVVTSGPIMSTPLTRLVAERTAKVAADLGVSGALRYLDICPESLQNKGFAASSERLPLRPIGWSFPDEELPPIVLDRERPLVYVTFASTEPAMPPERLRDIATAIARLPVDVLVSTGRTDPNMPGLPDNVHLRSWVPQNLVIPHCALVVHHGGPGAMLNSMAAGLPQLVLPDPHGAEPGMSLIIRDSGAGELLPQDEITVDLVHDLAKALLSDDHPARAVTAALAHEIAAMPTPAMVIDLLDANSRA
jgi:UDP:flavonoid glycosyltransferase YjiC (YdhE family)